MATWTLKDLAAKMRDIDFTMLVTRTDDGQLAGRPMSNNGDVEYDGDSFFFAWGDSRVVKDIEREPKVAMTLQGKGGLLGKPPLFISVEGKGEIIRDKAAFAEHWNKDLERWFDKGIDTPGLAMIKVRASRLHYWDGEENGDIVVA